MADVVISSLPYTISGAGDRYLLPSGTTLTGILTIAAANATIVSDGDSEAVLTTARQITGSWTSAGGGEWYADLPSGVTNNNAQGAYVLLIDGEVIKKGGTIGALASGYWQYDTVNFRVYINSGGSAPSGSIYVGTDSCVSGSAATMPSGLVMRGIEVWGANNGIQININGATRPSNILIDQCRLHRNGRAGLIVLGGDGIQLTNSYIAHNQATAIKFGNSDTNANNAVNASRVTNCLLEWNNSADCDSNSEGHLIDVGAQGAGVIISGNEFRRNGYSSGNAYRFTYDPASMVSLDGVAGASVNSNYVHHNYIGFVGFGASSAHTNLSQRVMIHGNLVVNNFAIVGTDGYLQSQVIFEPSTVAAYDASNCYVVNNTFANNVGDEASANQFRPATFYATANTAYDHTLPSLHNNVFVGNTNVRDVVVNFIGAGTATIVSSHNVFSRDGNFAYVRVNSGDAGASASTAAEWQSLSGDSTSVDSDPLLDADYRPKVGSPALGAGTRIDGLKDFYGKDIVDTPDIGAIQLYAARTVGSARSTGTRSTTTDRTTPLRRAVI